MRTRGVGLKSPNFCGCHRSIGRLVFDGLTHLAGFALAGAGAGAGYDPCGLGLDRLAADDALVVLHVGPEWLHVGLVDVIDDDGGDGDDLGGPGRHHRHQDEEQHGVLAGGAQQLLGDQRCGKTCSKLQS